MNKKMLVECDPHQTRVAILEQDRLAELFIERRHQLGIVGNIYQGRVNRVLPGMQAAFVDIGLDRDAFLYVSEVIDPLATVEETEALEPKPSSAPLRGVVPPVPLRDVVPSAPLRGDARRQAEAAAGKRLEPVAPVPIATPDPRKVPARDGGLGDLFGQSSGEVAASENEQGRQAPERPSIDQLLKTGQEIMVQVLKDAMPNKGARVTTQITLPGRSLVLLPNVPHLGISRRIEDDEERQRLRLLLEELQPPGNGLIVRTAGEGSGREEMESDLAYLSRLWQSIRRRGEQVSAPTLLHRDLDLALRIVRDYLAGDYTAIWVDAEESYERLVGFVDQIQPSMLGRIRLFQQDSGLFEHFAIEDQIDAALRTKVWLKSGGHIVINPTEALVAIDVNTGRYVGRHNLEDTVLTTNLEAVKEIVRQIRLRNLGGIIVLDLIDMEESVHRQQVFDALACEMAKDRARNKVLNISEFGLVEITRKRSRPSLERLLTQSCPYCRGTGRVKSLSTICLDLRRQILQQKARFQSQDILLRVHPDVARALQREGQPILRELEHELSTEILIQSDSGLHHERFDILEV